MRVSDPTYNSDLDHKILKNTEIAGSILILWARYKTTCTEVPATSSKSDPDPGATNYADPDPRSYTEVKRKSFNVSFVSFQKGSADQQG